MDIHVVVSKMVGEKKWKTQTVGSFKSVEGALVLFYQEVAKSASVYEPIIIRVQDQFTKYARFHIG